MKGKALAAGAAVGGVIALGLGAREVSGGSECMKPLTLLGSEQTASIQAMDGYIEREIAPTFKNPKSLVWGSDDYSPTLEPGVVAARIMVMVGGETRYYNVRVERECVGDAWKVVKFQPVK